MKKLLLVSSVLALSACSTTQKTDIVAQMNQQLNKYPSAVGEKATEVTGKLEVIYFDDFENNRGEKRYFVHDKQKGKRFELKFQGKPPKDATTGSFIRVRGKKANNELNLENNNELITMAANDSSSYEVLAAATPQVSGEQKTIVLVANFNDAIVSCPIQDIKDIMFTDVNDQSVDDLYRETSLNKVQFTGDVAGPFTIDYSSTIGCDSDAWASATEAQALANGIDLSQYSRRVYVLPKENACGFTGLSTLGGTPSRSWNFRCELPDVYAHELGHALGMGHANETLMGEYADLSDIMGYSSIGLRQINGPHQEQMGWREPQQTIEINSEGVHEIAPLEQDAASSNNPQLLKVRKPDTGEWYYLSYRQATGFDASLSYTYLTGVSIHHYTGDGSSSHTLLVDTLSDGESFSDSSNDINITQISHSTSSVILEVNFPVTCTQNSPTVSLTPQSQTGLAGSTFSYNLTLVNNDSASCQDSTWDLATVIPSDWLQGLTTNIITTSPSESITINWQITSPSSAENNDYTLTIGLEDINTPTHDSLHAINYTVALPADTQPPTAPTLMTASEQRKNTLLSWEAATDNIAVAGYRIYRDAFEIAITTSTTYTDPRSSGKGYSYYTRAFDADNNFSALSEIVSATTNTDVKTNKGKKR